MGLVTESQLKSIEKRISTIESQMGGVMYDMREVARSEITAGGTVVDVSQMQYGLYTALCIDTVDIWKQNRIRFYSPLFHNPQMKVEQLPWAHAISNMGGFDDCGMTWVPPAGSTVCILFENGNRSAPYYIGTTWQRNRGPDGQHKWGFNIDEYYRIWEGQRRGYLVGANDGSQVFPPWNTENYNGFDLNSAVDFTSNPEAQRNITYPNIYGFKTPEKHMIKMVDGDPKCNRKWKRFEIMSSCGNWIMLKDDHMHYAGQWAHPECGGVVKDGDVSCSAQAYDETAPADQKYEENFCEEKKSNKKIIGGHPTTPGSQSTYHDSQMGANPYFKHRQECRPYRGSQTPQNNAIDLPQSGIQIHSISGHTFVMDDSVEEPSGSPTWDREFDFGCNNKYLGRTYWKSATGHMIEMSDVEGSYSDDKAQLRGEYNYIRLLSANGNKIELNDHTQSEADCQSCPPNIAGERRGILLQSTSNHIIQMSDEGNEQCGSCRVGGGEPAAKAKKAFVKIRTGYGLEMSFNDESKQDQAENQNIVIYCPNKKNAKGPHIMRFQEAPPDSPGLVLLRVAGNYMCVTTDDHTTVVGNEKEPHSVIEYVTKYNLVYTKNAYINVSERDHLFLAKDRILLMAGADCPRFKTLEEAKKFAEENKDKSIPLDGPCLAPICVLKDGAIMASDRVFASCSPDATVLSIFQLKPFFKPPPKNQDATG